MDLLQLREDAIFNTLKAIRNYRFVVIGGYAVNAYALPRFSIDCDIVVENVSEQKKIEKALLKEGYSKKTVGRTIPYGGEFFRYEKEIADDFFVSMDLLCAQVIDRQTNASFHATWIFEHATKQLLKGKTITKSVPVRIVGIDALITMKLISCRLTDIRDIFMLIPKAEDTTWIKNEVNKRTDFQKRYLKAKEKIISKQFKDSLQGVFGRVNEITFEKHQKAFLDLEE